MTFPHRVLRAHGETRSDVGLWSDVATWLLGVLPLLVVAAVATTYVALAVRERGGRGWNAARTASFLTGCLLLATAFSPRFDSWADADFGGHMAQHLLVGMVGPLALVLGAPVTLLLRTLPHLQARRLGRLLHTLPVRWLTNPVTALVLSGGGLLVLYFTPLYELSTRNTTVHLLVYLHLVLAGALFAWAIAGPDPAPFRASVRTRLIVLGVSIALHASVSQLLYAGILVRVEEPVAEMRAAGSLMYFGGDVAELLLALALLTTWRRPATTSRRVPGARPGSLVAPREIASRS